MVLIQARCVAQNMDVAVLNVQGALTQGFSNKPMAFLAFALVTSSEAILALALALAFPRRGSPGPTAAEALSFSIFAFALVGIALALL